jgi:hypothetical protein
MNEPIGMPATLGSVEHEIARAPYQFDTIVRDQPLLPVYWATLMVRQYAPRSFLRHASNALLARYSHEQQLLADFDIAGLAETDVEPMFAQWEQLPDTARTQIDADFRLVDELADEEGLQTLLDEARFHGEDLEPAFSELDGFHDKLLWALLERRTYVDVASRFRQADHLPGNYWLRHRGVPAVDPRDGAAGREALADAVGAYFRQREARGYACVVEAYRRADRYYYFAYPEDYAHTQPEFDDGQFRRQTHRPAFEVVFAYSAETGTLDTYCRGKRQLARDLREIFGRVVLGIEVGDPDKDERVYELNRLKRRDFEFVYDPSAGIEDVRLTLLRLSLLGGGNRRITVEADPSVDGAAVTTLMEEVLGNGRIPSALANVTRAGIRVTFHNDGRRGRRSRTFYLSHPNGCTLKHDGVDATLRQMLADSGLEPTLPGAT